MVNAVRVDRDGDIGLVTIDNPPLNTLSEPVRTEIAAALATHLCDAAVQVILLRAEGRTFPAGADFTEFDQASDGLTLGALAAEIEAAPKPVVAALFGTVLGGGLELALAAHYRVAAERTRFGFPEVTLGTLPGAGGTQRMPRITGAKPALDLLLSGHPIAAADARTIGLVDDVVQSDLDAAARVFARGLVAEAIGLQVIPARAEGFADPIAFQAEIAARRDALAPDAVPAAARIIDCVEAAMLLPFDAGLAYEAAAAAECTASDVSRALRHLFVAERAVRKIPERHTGQRRAVASVGIFGAGPHAAGLTLAVLEAGLPAVVVTADDTSRRAVETRIDTLFARAVKTGRMSADAVALRRDLMISTTDADGLAAVDFVCDASGLRALASADALARAKPTATIGLVDERVPRAAYATATGRPESVVALAFPGLPHRAGLAEVHVSPETSADAVRTAFALVKALGKTAVRARADTGLVGHRVMGAALHAADDMLGRGATPGAIDRALARLGFANGLFGYLDTEGLGQTWIRAVRARDQRDPSETGRVVGERLWEHLVDAGALGRVTGRGYFRYDLGETASAPVDDPDVVALLAAEREAADLDPRSYSAREIRDRILLAMANEGARLVSEDVVQRPSDIDVIMVHGFGFPRRLGGPMLAADMRGLLTVSRQLSHFAPDADSIFGPAPLIAELIKTGTHFSDLNVAAGGRG